jgi:2-dehydropantoate 2-reductase
MGQALLSGAVCPGDDGLGEEIGAVRSDASWHSHLEACVAEACTLAVAEGAKLTPQPIFAALEGAPDALRSSMQKDVAAGRAPELDAIAGRILRGGDEHGVEVPATQALVDHILRGK